MNAITVSNVILVTVVLLVVWLLLARMISSRREDARLQFLLSLMEPPPVSVDRPSPAHLQPAANLPETRTEKDAQPGTDDAGPPVESLRTQSVWQELPVVFAAALRGRAM